MAGLCGPEGIYVPAASYVLPPGPPLAASSLSSGTPALYGGAQAGSGANAGTAAGAGASSSSVPSGSLAAAQATSGAGGFGSSFSPLGQQGSPGGVASQTAANGGANAGTSNGKRAGVATGSLPTLALTASSLRNGTASAITAVDDQHRATALTHISMHAPSVWAGVATLTPARVSVASVRVPQQTSAYSMSASGTLLAPPNSSVATSTPASGADRRGSCAATVSSSDGSHADSSPEHSDREQGTGRTMGISSRFMGFGGSAEGPKAPADGGNNSTTGSAPWHPVIEATLSSQGIDGTASHVTGGLGGMPGVAALQLLAHLGGSSNNSTSSGGHPSGPLVIGSAATPGGLSSGRNLLKPKNNLKQTSSSFIARLQVHPDFTKLLSGQRQDGNVIERHVFVSRGRMLGWLGETTSGWIKDPIMRVFFNAPITSHDVNQWTRSPSRLDVIIGFSSSDIIWLEAISMRYGRINKSGSVYDAPVSNVRWVPGSETLLIATHSDGTCSLFEVGRDDCQPGTWTPRSGQSHDDEGLARGAAASSTQYEQQEVSQPPHGDEQISSERRPVLEAKDNEVGDDSKGPKGSTWDPHQRMLVTRPSMADVDSSKKWARQNPVAHWRVARPTTITDLAFSPDHTKLALVATDGGLRIINLMTEALEGTFESYYGALNRVVWSPDAKFLLTAGCDDLISVWTNSGHLLSRCPGHQSFVTGLAFDPWRWRVEDRTYRFVSVGEDGQVFLWDFSSAALHRPRATGTARNTRRASGQAGFVARSHSGSTSLPRGQQRESMTRRGSSFASKIAASWSGVADESGATPSGIGGNGENGAIYVLAQSRREVAELQPVASYQVGPITGQDAVCNAAGAVSAGCTIPGAVAGGGSADGASSGTSAASDAAMSRSTSAGAAGSTAGVPLGTGPSGATNVGGAGSSSQGAATGAAGASGSSAAHTGAAGTTAAGGSADKGNNAAEQGGPGDSLVDVRCRPDGLLLVHKSGTLRFLRRPSASA